MRKVVASAWRMPLLRMDPGVLYQKFIGESEARLREALNQAESMAPVVLWIDEIEKAFASASSDSADGGLSQRMFGTLLSWMQDHRQPIFLIATANNIAQLPPELVRKGRFDEVFFVDLPGPAERKAIFNIHLRKRRRDAAGFDVSVWWPRPRASPARRSSRRSSPASTRRSAKGRSAARTTSSRR